MAGGWELVPGALCLVASGWWLVVGGWRLVVGACFLLLTSAYLLLLITSYVSRVDAACSLLPLTPYFLFLTY